MRKPVHEIIELIRPQVRDSTPWKHYSDLTKYKNNKLFLEWGIDSIPYNFLIDKDGKLIDKVVSMKQLEKILSKL